MVSTVVVIGIAAGAVVFVGTILTVFFLLHQGGSFDRMRQEAVGMPTVVGELKPQLYDELLTLANKRALKPSALESPLKGELIEIRNLSAPKDIALLHAISNGNAKGGIYGDRAFDADELIWRYLSHGPFKTEADFGSKHCSDLPDNRHFVIVEGKTKQPIGMLSLKRHSPQDLRVEIGDIWLVPAFQGSGALTEVVLLMLQRLFDLKYRRVEMRCDGHNVRARRAAHSLGFTFEGVLRKHAIVKECNRDTVIFAAINSDWPAIEEHLKGKLASALAKINAESEADGLTKKQQ
ncbi:hypothetical protein Poli38472_008457 [Pythium oligandrum]|uniref:N-acetyltransferase domain-containing protein n=1 Tax=Pythium oligandrum TaxID=41045 RepID=A0A8K1C3H6_PYTOL|nr:hypothetical protein Poli38472_008457 [Pythium oligandrum]|eukprot:TMW55809.1 hypothetical protein Poli38472_008457 [Pythium oligandrum]